MTWPLMDASFAEAPGNAGTSSGLITITASGTAHTKGAWTELVAATLHEYTWIVPILFNSISTAATNTSMLIDIGVGAAASEVTLIENIGVGHASQGRPIPFPLRITAGSRIAARCQAAVVSDTADLALLLLGGGGWNPPPAGTIATTYGANTGTSSGVTLILPGAVNTEAAWTQIDAATARPMRWMVPLLVGHPTDTAWGAANGLLDIGVGAAASEVPVASNLAYTTNSNEGMSWYPQPIPVNIPAGIRLAARYQASNINEAPALIVIGID